MKSANVCSCSIFLAACINRSWKNQNICFSAVHMFCYEKLRESHPFAPSGCQRKFLTRQPLTVKYALLTGILVAAANPLESAQLRADSGLKTATSSSSSSSSSTFRSSVVAAGRMSDVNFVLDSLRKETNRNGHSGFEASKHCQSRFKARLIWDP